MIQNLQSRRKNLPNHKIFLTEGVVVAEAVKAPPPNPIIFKIPVTAMVSAHLLDYYSMQGMLKTENTRMEGGKTLQSEMKRNSCIIARLSLSRDL